MSAADSDPLFPPRPTALAQEILRPLIRPGDLVIDATAGNGHDTLFLAECVGPAGKVLAFDVQAAAHFLGETSGWVTGDGWIFSKSPMRKWPPAPRRNRSRW